MSEENKWCYCDMKYCILVKYMSLGHTCVSEPYIGIIEGIEVREIKG